MKNMQNFAAQQLTKKQMNDVKGGAAVTCFWKEGEALKTVLGTGGSFAEAADDAYSQVPSGVNAHCVTLS